MGHLSTRLLTLTGLVLLTSLVLLPPRPAWAKTLYVDAIHGNDSNVCGAAPLTDACATLTAAVSKTQDGDTIQVAAGIYHEHVTIARDVTVQGDPAGSTILDGQQDGQQQDVEVVRIISDATPPTVTLQHLTIQNGAGQEAGGIHNFGTLTVANCTITKNSATAGSGGGINNRHTLTVQNSTISNNTARGAGGGILNVGILTVQASTLTGNTASSTGGGIDNQPGATQLRVINSTITGNTASGDGEASRTARRRPPRPVRLALPPAPSVTTVHTTRGGTCL